jgi:integrase
MPKTLTDRSILALKPKEGKRLLLHDHIVPGLAVRVTEAGVKTFVLIKRLPGKSNPVPRALGRYGELTIDAAREKARKWLELISQGIDPAHHEAQERAAEIQKGAETVGKVFELFSRQHLSKLRTGAYVNQTMRRIMKPWWDRPLSSIAKKDVSTLIHSIHDRGAATYANRNLSYLKKYFRWCVQRDFIEQSPAILVDKPSREQSRSRVLEFWELHRIWDAAAGSPLGSAIRFMIATAARRSEAGKAKWEDISKIEKLWKVPDVSGPKGKRKNELPLNSLALDCLGREAGTYVFSTTNGRKPISGWSKIKARIDAQAQIAPWTLHDLRRTVATNLGKLGVDRLVISRILSHVDGGVTARYDRYGRDEEMAAAMDLWGQKLREIITGEPSLRSL